MWLDVPSSGKKVPARSDDIEKSANAAIFEFITSPRMTPITRLMELKIRPRRNIIRRNFALPIPNFSAPITSEKIPRTTVIRNVAIALITNFDVKYVYEDIPVRRSLVRTLSCSSLMTVCAIKTPQNTYPRVMNAMAYPIAVFLFS